MFWNNKRASTVLNKEQKVKVCDATDDDSINVAWFIKNLYSIIDTPCCDTVVTYVLASIPRRLKISTISISTANAV